MRKARPKPASGVHGQSTAQHNHPASARPQLLSQRRQAPRSRRASRRAELLRPRRRRPTHGPKPARPYAVKPWPMPLLELLPGALAQRHGRLGHIRRARSDPWPRPLPQSSFHHTPPARAAYRRRSHVSSTRSPPAARGANRMVSARATGRLRCQAHRGGRVGKPMRPARSQTVHSARPESGNGDPHEAGNRVRDTCARLAFSWRGLGPETGTLSPKSDEEGSVRESIIKSGPPIYRRVLERRNRKDGSRKLEISF